MLKLTFQNGTPVHDAQSVKLIFNLKQRTIRFTSSNGRSVVFANGSETCYMASMGRSQVYNIANLIGTMFGVEADVLTQNPEEVTFIFKPDPSIKPAGLDTSGVPRMRRRDDPFSSGSNSPHNL